MGQSALEMTSDIAREAKLPPVVLLLAEHLDAILAAGEDLAALDLDLTGLSHPGAQRDTGGEPASLNAYMSRVRAFEGVLLLRLERARSAATRLFGADERFAPAARLFLAGTGGLADALTAVADECAGKVDGARCPLAFMRRRGLVGDDCGAFTGLLRLELGGAYLVGGAIPLGVVLDHAATFLDVLDRYYDLFPEAAGDMTAASRVSHDADPASLVATVGSAAREALDVGSAPATETLGDAACLEAYEADEPLADGHRSTRSVAEPSPDAALHRPIAAASVAAAC
ncbi:MAG: hypothetical protein R3D27_11140 [Hyphomicrobiaceae bacterium]